MSNYIHHGGCHGCTQNWPLFNCKKCKYYNCDWSLPDLNISHRSRNMYGKLTHKETQMNTVTWQGATYEVQQISLLQMANRKNTPCMHEFIKACQLAHKYGYNLDEKIQLSQLEIDQLSLTMINWLVCENILKIIKEERTYKPGQMFVDGNGDKTMLTFTMNTKKNAIQLVRITNESGCGSPIGARSRINRISTNGKITQSDINNLEELLQTQLTPIDFDRSDHDSI